MRRLRSQGCKLDALQRALQGYAPGARRKQRMVRWTILPTSGLAMDGEPRTFERTGTVARRKARIKTPLHP
ncbi:MAG: hypothetical protein A3E57_05490 [Candidatus Muproteobacteria bacterium RIFCSPHIGHO2_12_FULL_60_33]|nr:MAG: hypothetical protein A3E57_05490 [Candidatus Muproteobacteria bacterium RIFCSPHIGHO2_12_FULL_60_33]